jgi:oligoribonuclease
MAANDLIVWCDLETTGLGLNDRVLEIGVAVTQGWELKRVGRGISIVIHQADLFFERMSEDARSMHEANGLIEESKCSVAAPYHAERRVLAYLRSKGVQDGFSWAAGNNIGWDRYYLRAHFPKLHNFLFYRSRDVSTLKGEFRDGASAHLLEGIPHKRELHRVLPDIQDSIAELRYYREHTRYI